MEFIELKDVYKVYKNGVTGLAGVNLKIKKGDFVFIIGHTASGKSTLIKFAIISSSSAINISIICNCLSF